MESDEEREKCAKWVSGWKELWTKRKDEALELNSKGIDVYQTNVEEGIKYFRAAFKLDPENSIFAQNLGLTLSTNKQNADAMKYLLHSLNYGPGTPQVFEEIGYLYMLLQNHEKAIEYYQLCLKLDPNSTFSLMGIASSLTELYKYEEALEHYKKVLEIDINNFYAHNGMGTIFYSKSNFRKAFKQYTLTVNIMEEKSLIEQDEIIFKESYCNVGISLIRMKEYQKALESIEKPFNNYNIQMNEYVYYCRGIALYKMGEYDKAIEDLEKAYNMDPKSDFTHKIWYFHAIALIKKANNSMDDVKHNQYYEEALNSFHKSVEICAHGWSKSLFRRGILLIKFNQLERALFDLQAAIKVNDSIHLCYRFSQKKIDQTIQEINSKTNLNINNKFLIIN